MKTKLLKQFRENLRIVNLDPSTPGSDDFMLMKWNGMHAEPITSGTFEECLYKMHEIINLKMDLYLKKKYDRFYSRVK